MNVLDFCILILLFFGVGVQGEAPAEGVKECYKCASPILKSNWAVSGFSTFPDDMVFTDSCNDSKVIGTVAKTCEMRTNCVELVIHIGGAPAYLRGCVDEFYGKDDSAKLPTVTEEKPVCTSAASSEGNSSKVYDIILYCMSQEASPPCNMRISSDDQPLNTLNCVEGSSRTCTYCSWFDDKGSCKHNNKGECRGVYCTKVVGKFGDRRLEMRGCSLNPLNAEYTYTDIPMLISVPGYTIDDKLQISTYFCNSGDHCNSANQVYSLIPLTYRNCCRACRFKKCLEAGLDPLMVHGDRGSISTGNQALSGSPSTSCFSQVKTELFEDDSPEVEEDTKCIVKSDKSYLLEEEYQKWHELALNMSLQMCDLNNKPLSAQRIIPDFNASDPKSVSKFFVLVERLCDDYFDSNASHMFASEIEYSCSTEVPSEKAFFQPRSISDRTKIDWSARYFLNSAGMKRMWCRIVTHYCDWVSHIPEFSKLNHADKLRLIIDRTVPCIDVLIAHRGMVANVKGVVFSGGSYFPRDNQEQDTMVDLEIKPYLKRITNWLYDEFIVPAKKINLTEAEYAILRLLIFFVPVDGLSEEGKQIVREAANFYRTILCNEIKTEFPHLKIDQIMDRLSSIMSFLQVIETAKVIEDEGFSVMTLFNIAQMKGELSYEVHIRKGTSSRKEIRSKNEDPGVHEHETKLLSLIEKITNGTQIHISKTGTLVTFTPGMIHGGTLEFDCGNTRCISYFLEALLMIAPFCKLPLDVTLKGVTNSHDELSVDAIRATWLPVFNKFVLNDENLSIKIKNRGFKPDGGGVVHFTAPIVKTLRTVLREKPGKICKIRGLAYVCKVAPSLGHRMIQSAKETLRDYIADVYITVDQRKGASGGNSPGFGLFLVAETTEGVFYHGEAMSLPRDTEGDQLIPEEVGQKAAVALLEEIYRGGCCDLSAQTLAATFITLCDKDVSKFLFGPLSTYSIETLRNLRLFFEQVFKIEEYWKIHPEEEEESEEPSKRIGSREKAILTGVGVGFSNLNKITL